MNSTAAALAAPADPTLPTTLRLILVALLILSAAMWIGGMAALTILTISSNRVLTPGLRTALFKDFGRRYLAVAGPALAVTVISGGILLAVRPWDAVSTAIVVVTAALVSSLGIGVRQARAMSRLRRAAADESEPDAAARAQRTVTVHARRALLLRALLGALTAALFVLAIATAA